MRNTLVTLGFLALLLTLSNCGSSRFLSPYSSLEPDSLYQVNDEDILAALQSNPQIGLPANLAIYHTGQINYSFKDSLDALEEITRIIEISPSLLDANSYYQNQFSGGWSRYHAAPSPIDLKKLRLYSAQAKSDLVLFISTSHRLSEDINILSPLYLGLVTIPFVPGQKVRFTTFMEAYLIDVRNGFLYASYRDRRVLKKKFARTTFSNKIDVYQQQHVEEMMAGLKAFTRSTLSSPDFQLRTNGLSK